MKNNTVKNLLPSKDVYLQFDEEELLTYGWEKGQKFTLEPREDGSVMLKPYVKLELDLSEFPREVLEYFVRISCEEDKSVNAVIADVISTGIERLEIPIKQCSNEAKPTKKSKK
jgi:hypothetical protein